jgi:cytochrome c peroxidase
MKRTSATVTVLTGAALGLAMAAWSGTPVRGAAAGAGAPPAATPKGEAFDSGDVHMVLPLGLQASSAYVRDDNPMSGAKIDLGRALYFDARLSADKTVSCATCHDPGKGFSDGRATSAGIAGKTGARSAPTVINRLFSADQFWDGRAADLEAQALGPIQNPIEMGHTLQGMIGSLSGIKGYAPMFKAAFGSDEISAERVGQAIATYERTVLSGDAPYDRYQAGDAKAMSPSAVRGLAIFNDAKRGNCVTCHAGFNFTDESYHNLGAGMDKPKPDLGRYEITKVETDRGAFKTPTLRNIADTAPYLHDGSEKTLMDVVAFYDRGGVKNPWLSKEIHPLNLTEQEKKDLVAFMGALTGTVQGTERPKSLP